MTSEVLDERWFPFPPVTGGRGAVDLFCVPHAGGSAALFRGWLPRLTPAVRVWAVELPGHGTRLREPTVRRVPDLVEPLAAAMTQVTTGPCALFGHSVGALVAFELARWLSATVAGPPAVLIASGCAAPALEQVAPDPGLPLAMLARELRRLGGTPEELLADEELLALRVAALRADFELVATYAHVPDPLLRCPVVVIGGVDDPHVPPAALEPWRETTTGPCRIVVAPGDHFFVHSSTSTVLATISLAIAAAGAVA